MTRRDRTLRREGTRSPWRARAEWQGDRMGMDAVLIDIDRTSERVNGVERVKRHGFRDAASKGVTAGGSPWIRVDELVNVGPHFSLRGRANAASFVTKERQPTE
eukprot:6182137-Pleurochrysis_carterae.AAC.1